MGLKFSDKIIVAICGLLIFFLSYVLLKELFVPKKRISGERQIASVDSFINDGRVKGSKDLHFKQVFEEDHLFNKDTLFTGPDSYLNVKLNTGGSLKLKPDSLIVLKQKEEKMAFHLTHGRMRGNLNKNQKLHLADKEGNIQSLKGNKNSDFLVNKIPGGIEIQVLDGDVELSTAQGVRKIKKNQKIKISEKGKALNVQNLEIELLSPRDSHIEYFSKNSDMAFSWKALNKSPFQKFELLMAKDINFKQVVKREENLQKGLFAEDLKAGTYYWKVKTSQNNKKIESDVFTFTLFKEQKPEIVYPKTGYEFMVPLKESRKSKEDLVKFENDQYPVTFVARDPLGAKRFKVQVSESKSFETVLVDENFKGDRIENIRLGEGKYFFRFKVISSKRPQAVWSETGSFDILKEEKPLIAPVVAANDIIIPTQKYPKWLYKAKRAKISEYLINKNIVVNKISWDSQSQESMAGFEYVLNDVTLTTTDNELRINDLYPSENFFKVRELSGEKKGPWSNELSFKTRIAPARSLSPEVFEEIWDGENRKGSAYIKWTPLLYAHGYEVFISQKENFKGAKSFLTKKAKYPFMIYFGKGYFWKVRAIDKKHRPISGFSETFNVKVLKKIVPIAEADESTGEIESTNYVERKLAHIKPGALRQKEPEGPLVIIPEFWLWAGAGYNFVNFTQKVNNFSDLNYQSLKGPGFFLSGGAFITEKIGFETSYKEALGEFNDTKNGGGVFPYKWKIFSLEALYRGSLNHREKKEGYYQRGSQWMWRLGFQQHLVPFLNVPNFSALTVERNENSILMAHGGASYFYSASKRIRYEAMMRYQHPLSSSGNSASFEVSPQFAFDGSLGVSYKFSELFSMGAYWYGQWHKFQYTYDGGAMTGEQDIFFTNFDLRLGIEY